MISPYTHNGQMNTTTLHAGEKAEMQMTFYKGQNYRILVCGQDMLGDIYFNVMDLNGKSIFSSKGKNKDVWDFNVTSTQDLIVEVVIPAASTKNQIIPKGCVSLLVGFKK